MQQQSGRVDSRVFWPTVKDQFFSSKQNLLPNKSQVYLFRRLPVSEFVFQVSIFTTTICKLNL